MKSYTQIISIFIFSGISIFSHGQNLYAKGKEEFLTGNYSSALKNLLKVHSGETDLNYFIAMSYFNLKEYSKAVVYFEKEIGKNPANYNAYLQKAEAEKIGHQYKSAIADLKKLEVLNPNYFAVQLSMGEIHFLQKNYKEALNCFNKAVELKPEVEKTYYKMGFCYLAVKDTANACASWKHLEDPDDFEEYKLIEKICK